MADKKISQLTTNPGIDGTEEMPTARGGSNFKNTLDALKTWLASVIGSLQAVTSIGNETTHNIGVKVGDNTGDAKTTVTPTGVVGQYKDDALPFAEISTAGISLSDGTTETINANTATGSIFTSGGFETDGAVTAAGQLRGSKIIAGSGAEWVLGGAGAGTTTPDTLIEVTIDGTTYQIPAKAI